jgi:CheY-like chemotaxis protein
MKTVNCILLVDDNPAINALHLMTIKSSKICNEIKIAANGEKALSYLKNGNQNGIAANYPKPDILFLDINMPRMNGFEFLDEYKNLDEKIKSKVLIILTTSSNPDDKQRAKTYKDVNEYRSKPLTVEMITEIVEKYF